MYVHNSIILYRRIAMGVYIRSIFVIIYQSWVLLLINGNASNIKATIEETSMSFLAAVSQTTHVDKTQLIIDFLSPYTPRAIHFIAPRRFGKTFNNNMLSTFLGAELEENGTRFSEERKKLKSNILKSIEPKLKAVQDTVFYEKNFANYIVFHLDFQTLGNSEKSSDEFRNSCFKLCYNQVYSKYKNWWKYILKPKLCGPTETRPVECSKLSDIFESDFPKDHELSLIYLLIYLRQEFKKRSILIIDNFDKPFINILRRTENTKLAYDALRHISIIFSPSLKTNYKRTDYKNPQLIHRTLFTGVTELPVEDCLENVVIYEFSVDKRNIFSNYYGFSKVEVDYLLLKHQMEEHNRNVELYYDGYSDLKTNQTVFNPLSITQFLKFKNLRSYWRVRATMSKLFQMCLYDSVHKKFVELITECGTTEIPNLSSYTLERFGFYPFNNILKICERNVEYIRKFHERTSIIQLFFSYMLREGYLTPVIGASDTYKLPNFEIKEEIQLILSDYMNKVLNVNCDDIVQEFMKVKNEYFITSHTVSILQREFRKFVTQGIFNKKDNAFDEQNLRALLICALGIYSVDVTRTILSYIDVETEFVLDPKVIQVNGAEEVLHVNKTRARADIYVYFKQENTVMIIETMNRTRKEARTQVAALRPKKDHNCTKLILIWVNISKKPVGKLTMGCIFHETYNGMESVGKKCKVRKRAKSTISPVTEN